MLRNNSAADPRLVSVLSGFRMDLPMPDPPVTHSSPHLEKIKYFMKLEHKSKLFLEKIYQDIPDISAHVEEKHVRVKTAHGNIIDLFICAPISRPKELLPCVYHVHGGGMAVYSATDVNYQRWRQELAQLNVVVVGVEFRNSAGSLGPHPFPAGMNDCLSGLKWVHEHMKSLHVSKIVIAGL
jgi:acetyl esterase